MVSISSSAQIKKTSHSFVLNGRIDSHNTDTIDIYYADEVGKIIQDSTITHNGKFLFNGIIKAPTIAWLHINGRGRSYKTSTILFIEPTMMKILVNEENINLSITSGSYTQNQFDSLNKEEVLVKKKISSSKPKSRIQTNLDTREMIKDQIKNLEFSFISVHPDSYLSPYLMEKYAKSIYRDTLKGQYQKLSLSIKHSIEGRKIYAYLHSQIILHQSPKIGDIAPDFNERDIRGKEISLSSYKGKSYILLDFWASWCGPCMDLIPRVQEFYARYHSKGLDVIGIGNDFTRENWQNAVTKENISQWENIFPLRIELSNECPLLENYGVTAIPALFLVNKEGKLIGIFKDKDQVNNDLSNILDGVFK